jgi:hypothetical protein
MHPKMKALAVTLALATVVTAAACGDDDVPDAATALESAAEESAADAMVPAPADVAGSDQHHFNRAAELARQERVNAAATARLTGEAWLGLTAMSTGSRTRMRLPTRSRPATGRLPRSWSVRLTSTVRIRHTAAVDERRRPRARGVPRGQAQAARCCLSPLCDRWTVGFGYSGDEIGRLR